MATNIVEFIIEDHLTVNNLFKEFENSTESKRLSFARQIFKELEVHTEIELKILYPTYKNEVENKESKITAEHAEHAHQELSKMIADMKEVQLKEIDEDGFREKMLKLKKDLNEHNEEEEKEILPKMQEKLEANRLKELCEEALQMKLKLMPDAKTRSQEKEILQEESTAVKPAPNTEVTPSETEVKPALEIEAKPTSGTEVISEKPTATRVGEEEVSASEEDKNINNKRESTVTEKPRKKVAS